MLSPAIFKPNFIEIASEPFYESFFIYRYRNKVINIIIIIIIIIIMRTKHIMQSLD